MTTLCRRCRSAPAVAVGICRGCGLREAEAERARLHRVERRQQAEERRQRRLAAPAGWPDLDGDAA